MADVTLSNYALDSGLNELHDADAVYICSDEPTTFYEAVATYALGHKSFSSPAAFFALPQPEGVHGRIAVSTAVINGDATVSGTANYWAAIDATDNRLLARGAIEAPGLAVLAGQKFTLDSLTLFRSGVGV